MSQVIYITHPEVVIDAQVPVPRWPLSDVGRARMAAIAALSEMQGVSAVYSSEEQKALDGAEILGAHLGIAPQSRAELGENDRSATGFVPEPAFSDLVAAFFGAPEESTHGWETAAHAQARVVAAIDAVCAEAPAGDVAVVGHGGVGTLLNLYLKGAPIALPDPRPPFGGWFVFDRDGRDLLQDWTAPPAPAD